MMIIYGKPSCGFCTKAKRFADDRQIAYEYKDVTNAKFLEELKEAVPGVKSVPQIFVNGDLVGGYTELVTYIEETGYTGSGHSL